MNTGISQIFDSANQTVVINQTFTYSRTGATPEIFWVVFAIAALIILGASLICPIRNQQGAINPARVALSAIGIIINACAAEASLVVDVISGSGTSTFENYTVNIVQHTLYEGSWVVIIFVVFGLLLFANLIYTILQPEMIAPDPSEYHREDLNTRVKAESSNKKKGIGEDEVE